jgi:hypothetical protein
LIVKHFPNPPGAHSFGPTRVHQSHSEFVLAEVHDTQFMLFGNLEKSVLGNAIRKKCQKKRLRHSSHKLAGSSKIPFQIPISKEKVQTDRSGPSSSNPPRNVSMGIFCSLLGSSAKSEPPLSTFCQNKEFDGNWRGDHLPSYLL